MEALDICETFSEEIFHNKDASNIIIRMQTIQMKELIADLRSLDYSPKRIVRESKTHSIINFEKIYPFELTFN